MIDPSNLAETLIREHRSGERFHAFPAEAGVAALEDAYCVQDAFVALKQRASAASAAGYKVGLTSRRMQEMCGIDQPIGGVVFSNTVHASGVALRIANYGRLGLEFEIGVRLARTLGAAGAPFALPDIGEAIGGVCAAVEVVDDRHADYSALDVRTLVADNSWNAGVVLGTFTSSWPDLARATGIARRDGEEWERGTGADVLGHPFEAVRWLANHLASQGRALKRGEIVMTGSIVRTVFPTEPARYEFEVGGIGAVAVDVVR